MNANEIDVKKLLQFFRINAEGKIERQYKYPWHRKGWTEISTKPNKKYGYSFINVECVSGRAGHRIGLHRLVWILHYGEDVPIDADLDHIDGDPSNNAIENLRVVSHRVNGQNAKRHRNGELPGAVKHKNRTSRPWMSSIDIGGKCRFLGYFDTPHEAHEHYIVACALVPRFREPKEFREQVKDIVANGETF
jgi:hypothetical protein